MELCTFFRQVFSVLNLTVVPYFRKTGGLDFASIAKFRLASVFKLPDCSGQAAFLYHSPYAVIAYLRNCSWVRFPLFGLELLTQYLCRFVTFNIWSFVSTADFRKWAFKFFLWTKCREKLFWVKTDSSTLSTPQLPSLISHNPFELKLFCHAKKRVHFARDILTFNLNIETISKAFFSKSFFFKVHLIDWSQS